MLRGRENRMISFPSRAHPRSKAADSSLAKQVVVPCTFSCLSTLWIPLDALIEEWADFGTDAATAPALTATGMAFLALSWETSALHHRTCAYQDQQCGLRRSAVRGLGQTMQDLSHATTHWSQAALWLERFANDERQPVEDLEPVRALMRQVLSQQQRVWTLMQEVQEDLLAYGQPVAEEPVRAGACNASEDQEEGTQ
jgi:hypothetical protein